MKMITKEFRDKPLQIEEQSIDSDPRNKAQKGSMMMETEKPVYEPKTGYKAKKKSKLRKTIVF